MSPLILQYHCISRRLAPFLCGLLSVLAVADIQASGFPPVGTNDTATVTRGNTVSVLDSGAVSVLTNDLDLEGDSLVAFLSRSVRHGELAFRSDGTFTYTHNGNNRDQDEFFYFAFDGTGFSRRTRVRIEIIEGDPVPPRITGQDNVSVNEDASLNIDIESLAVTDPDNDFPQDFTLEVRDGQNYSRSGTTITPSGNFNGSLSVPVRVNDGTDFSNLFTLNVDVDPVNDAPSVLDVPMDQEAIENTPFSLELAGFFDDIDSNDALRFSASGLPSSGSLTINRTSGILSGTPVAADASEDSYRVNIRATDLAGASAILEFRLTVFADDRSDLAVTAGIVVNPVTVSENAQWNVEIENLGPADLEEGALSATWSTSGPALSLSVPEGCTVAENNSAGPSLQCVLNGLLAGTTRSITVAGVQDGNGDNSLIVTAAADDPNMDNNTVLVGAQVVAEFSEGPAQILEVSGTGIASGDLNDDGFQDLIVLSEQTVLFFNSGDRAVSAPGLGLGESSQGAAVLALDWNGDSLLDVAVAGAPGAAARVFLNSGNEEFSGVVDLDYQGAGSIVSAAAADFDQNGFVDLVLTGTNNTTLLQNFGDTDPVLTTLSEDAGIDVSTADFNNDTYQDIVFVAAADRTVNLLQNAGDGVTFSVLRLSQGSVAAATGTDLDGDGDVDLMLAIDGGDLTLPESRVLIQVADGTFSEGDAIGASALSKMLAGDMDGDTVPDIVAFNAAGVHQLYRGLPDGQFVLSAEQIVSAGMRDGVLVDFNNDDSLDLIMAGPNATVVEIHANNGLGKLGLGDRTAPTLQLLGESVVSLAAGATFVDPGVVAEDDVDGDLSNAVLVSGNVNTSVVGSYTVSYSVADKAGNLVSISRVVNVGIREGLGGGGGGRVAPFMLVLLLSLVVLQRYRQCAFSKAAAIH